MPENPTFQGTDHQFFLGLVSDSSHKPVEMCEGKVDIVGTQKTFINGLVSAIHTEFTHQEHTKFSAQNKTNYYHLNLRHAPT